MRISTATLTFSAALVACSLLAAPLTPAAGATTRPSSFVSVSAESGPGRVTIRWKQDGRGTTGYVLETALSQFGRNSGSLPAKGRHHRVWAIPASARSFTLSGSQLAAAGAPAGSGNYLYFRLSARNARAKGAAALRGYPYLRAVAPQTEVASGTKLRIASWNVRTARATGSHTWLKRRSRVAAQIVRYSPEVVALQELGPGRADGKVGSTTGHMRQTTSLLGSLRSQHGSRYRMVRTTPYVEPGKNTNTQGMRLLYDSSRVGLVSHCSETTGSRSYSSSCMFDLPLLHGDSGKLRRHAAYAQFRDLASGKRFYVVSAHLDIRHNKNMRKEAVYNRLRATQMKTVVNRMAAINTEHLPLAVAGDMNSWQTIAVGNGPHDTLVSNGFTDTAAAKYTRNLKYSTFNGFAKTQHTYPQGFGSRLDLIMTKGFAGPVRFENVTKRIDPARPADHNMIVADTVL